MLAHFNPDDITPLEVHAAIFHSLISDTDETSPLSVGFICPTFTVTYISLSVDCPQVMVKKNLKSNLTKKKKSAPHRTN